MCGIVGAVAERNIIPVLMEGLRRLEYRGYDSAGLAALDEAGKLDRRRTLGKVAILANLANAMPIRICRSAAILRSFTTASSRITSHCVPR